jgi:hypothetical protein
VSPDNFDGDRSKGYAFLTSCELYLSLTGPDYPDEQAYIHWALSFFKSGCLSGDTGGSADASEYPRERLE